MDLEPDNTAKQSTPGGLALDGFKAAFKSRNFRLLFIGQAASGLGDWVGTLAFIAAAEDLSGGNAFAVTGVLVLRLVPTLFATPIGGVIADRFDRKRIMIWCDVIRFLATGAVVFVPNLGALYALAFLHECFSLIFLPARDASVPNIVPTEQLEAANGLMMVSSYGGIPLSGPVYGAIAAIAIHFPSSIPTESRWRPDHGGHAWALTFLFDAFTFLISAWAISKMDLPRRQQAGSQVESMGSMLRGGIAYVRSSRLLRGLAYAVSLGLLGGGVLFAKGISYVKETLGGSDVAFGYLMGIFGGGMVLGFFISQRHGERSVFWMLRGSLFLMGGVLITMSAFPLLWIAYLMAAVFGATFAAAIILGMTQAQSQSPDDMRGRVMASVHILVRVALLTGALGAAGIGQIFHDGLRIEFLHYNADSNQVALAIAGALIALGVLGIRGAKADLR
ncbi:MAG: hypothetical protein NVSMB57_09810 [Actinomycetota bacterium]